MPPKGEKKKTKQGGNPHAHQGYQGGGNYGGGGGFSAEERAIVKELAAERKVKAEAIKKREMSSDIIRMLADAGVVDGSKAMGALSSISTLGVDESESEGSHGADYRRELKRTRELLALQENQTKELREKVDELASSKKESELLHTKVEGRLTSAASEPSTEDDGKTRLTLEEWNAMKVAAKHESAPPTPSKVDLFADLADDPSDTDSSAVAAAIIATLKERLQQADAKLALRLGIEVSQKQEDKAKEVATMCAEKHFEKKADFQKLKALRDEFYSQSTAKLPKTVLTALIRAAVSRPIPLCAEDLKI